MSAHSLSNIDNYKQHTNQSSTVAFSKYLNVVGDYLVQCSDNIHMTKTGYYKYVVSQGLKTISHIFLTLYLYTNNLELTAYHCQKAIYYYIEFIGQIGDEHHSFLQLNSKDATLFVYKKTIFEVDNAFRKEFACPKLKWSPQSNLDNLISIYVRQSNHSIESIEFTSQDKTALIKNHKLKIDSLCRALMNLSLKGEEEFGQKLDLLEVFYTGMAKYDICTIEYMESFAKRLRKKNTTELQVKSKLQSLFTKLSDSCISTYPATKLAQIIVPS